MFKPAFRSSPALLVAILGGMTAIGPFTMDLYLPAFPEVARAFGASEAAVQATLTATAIGLGAGGLLVGPLSDRVGRRGPLIIALLFHVLASIGIAMAPSIELVSVLRAVQGAGAAAGGVLSSAMVRDMFGGLKLVRFLARIALVNGLAPIIAPVIGSQLLRVIDWRGVFVALSVYGAVVVVAVTLFVPETIRPTQHTGSSPLHDLRTLVTDRSFFGAVIVGGMMFSAIIGFLSLSPFILQDGFGLTPQQFGLYFAAQAVGLLIATQGAARLMRRFPPARLLAISVAVLGTSGITLIVVYVANLGLPLALCASALLVATVSFSGPCLQVLVLHGHPKQAGSAAAIAGFSNSVVGGLLSSLPALAGHTDFIGLGTLVVGVSLCGSLAIWTLIRPWHAARLEPDDLTGPIVVP